MLKHFELARLLSSPSVCVLCACVEERIHSKLKMFSSLSLLLLILENFMSLVQLHIDSGSTRSINSLNLLHSLLYT